MQQRFSSSKALKWAVKLGDKFITTKRDEHFGKLNKEIWKVLAFNTIFQKFFSAVITFS